MGPLAPLRCLEDLSIAETHVQDVAPVSRLRSLDITRNEIADLTPFGGMTAIETLLASDTKVVDLRRNVQHHSLQALYLLR